MSGATRWWLAPERMPEAWFNAAGHIGAPEEAPLRPGDRQPVGVDDLAQVLPRPVAAQELCADPWVDVPGAVLDFLRRWRPTPLVRAAGLEAALATPARIYYKDESVSPTGSHHPSTSVPQAFYAKGEGATRVVTDSATGLWGSALALAAALCGLDATVYTGQEVSDEERFRMQTWGASVAGSWMPSLDDALTDVAEDPESRFAAGSVFNHVVLHQTVIGLEAARQLTLAGEERPDVVIGCCGSGSCLAGTALPFAGDEHVRLVAVEPASWPTLTGGRFGYVPADAAGLLPLLAMYSLGPDSVPPAEALPGIRSSGVAPVVCDLVRSGRMAAVSQPIDRVREAAVQWARTEGPVPSLATAHAVRAVVDEAVLAREAGTETVILFPWSGHARG